MIKVNLIAERKVPKGKPAPGVKVEGTRGGQNFVLIAVVLIGVIIAGAWMWTKSSELKKARQRNEEARAELVRLEEVRRKGDYYKQRKALLERQIQLVTDLKKQQTVPVHILDQISKNLPDFLWLDAMTANNNVISIRGKATTYNAVSNFYNNLNACGYFAGVDLGRTAEAPEGVSFTLTCSFVPPGAQAAEESQGS